MNKDLTALEVEGQHKEWSNELNAVNAQLDTCEKQLSSLASESNKVKVEHFQNQFLIQRSAIAKLKNEIKKHDFAIEREGTQPMDTMANRDMEYHNAIGEKIKTELRIMGELFDEFNQFVK